MSISDGVSLRRKAKGIDKSGQGMGRIVRVSPLEALHVPR